VDKELRDQMKDKKKAEQARLVGKLVAERAKNKGITAVVFDRGGFQYTDASRRWQMVRGKAACSSRPMWS